MRRFLWTHAVRIALPTFLLAAAVPWQMAVR
jgi:hypothetical protein